MEPTDQQREQFAAALDERMRAAGDMSQQDVAAALEARGHKVSRVTVGNWRTGTWLPAKWPLVEALDEIVGAGGELVEILGAPKTGLRERVEQLEGTQAETVRLTAEMRSLRDELQALIAELRQDP